MFTGEQVCTPRGVTRYNFVLCQIRLEVLIENVFFLWNTCIICIIVKTHFPFE